MSIRTVTTLAALLGSAALPAAAQQACGSGALWIGGTEDASDVATFSEAMRQVTLAPQNGSAVTLFTLSSPQAVRLEAEGVSGEDTVIDLLDAQGTLIDSDDDGGGNLSSRLEVELDPGTYCLSTRGFSGTMVPANVSIGLQSHEAMTEGFTGGGFGGVPECLPETDAQTLGAGTLGTGEGEALTATAPIGAVPFYRFTLSSEMPIVITSENPSADPYTYLYDGSGGLIAENDDFDGLNSRIELSDALAPGTYCVALEALSDETQPVTVTVAAFDAAAAQASLIERGEAAPPLDGSYPVTSLGALQTRLRAATPAPEVYQYFSFDMPQSGLATVEAIGQGGVDPVVILFDEFGREVAYNDDGPTGLDSFLAQQLNIGTYILGIGQFGDQGSGGVALALQRWVPAQ